MKKVFLLVALFLVGSVNHARSESVGSESLAEKMRVFEGRYTVIGGDQCPFGNAPVKIWIENDFYFRIEDPRMFLGGDMAVLELLENANPPRDFSYRYQFTSPSSVKITAQHKPVYGPSTGRVLSVIQYNLSLSEGVLTYSASGAPSPIEQRNGRCVLKRRE